MEYFFGFDLGDAESAVSILKKGNPEPPQVISVGGSKSFVTAYAMLEDGSLLTGETSCFHPQAVRRRLRFKSRFLNDVQSKEDILQFSKGVLNLLKESPGEETLDESCFYIGCPAGWGRGPREEYRRIFEKAGFPPARIVSESRAALVSACQSRHLQVGYDILSHPVLVVDIGSSTTDFAYIMGGKEVELKTAGEVALGGGLMDEELLRICVQQSRDRQKTEAVLKASEPWRSYCEFSARRLKEKYYSDEKYWETNDCVQNVRIMYRGKQILPLVMNKKISEKLLFGPLPSLDGRSFHDVFMQSLRKTRESLTGDIPQLLFLTGGVSRLSVLADWCREVYPEAVVITSLEPEFSVSRGLAWCGRIDEDMRSFTKEVEDLKDSSTVEQIVAKHIPDLYREAVNTLTGPILAQAAMPVIDRWRNGRIKRLSDIDAALEKEITAWLHTKKARDLLVKPVARWLKPVGYELEEYTVPICVRHNVPYKALSLNSYLSLSDIDIHVEAKNVFAVEEMTWMIDTIITLVVGLLCGGGGIALIANGLPGIIAGAVISIMILFLGKDKLQNVLLNADIPYPVRRLLRRSYFENRLDKMAEKIKADFYESIRNDKNEEISDRLAEEISAQIDECLIRMAKVVEIPLGT